MKSLYRALLITVAAGLSAVGLAAELGTSFTVLDVSGTVTAKVAGEMAFAAAQKGVAYAYGTELRTGRKSFAVLSLSPGNTVRMLAKTRAVIGPTVTDPKLVKVDLKVGELDVKLDDFPVARRFSVDTPVGICGVTGTHFTVSHAPYEGAGTEAEGSPMYTKVACAEGQVALEGSYVQTQDDTIRPGGLLEFVVLRCLRRHYVYFPLVSVKGQDMRIAFGLDNRTVLEDESVVQAAMANVPGTAPFVALRVIDGRVLVGGGELTQADQARFIRGDTAVADLNAEDYMNAAEWLCRECRSLLEQGAEDNGVDEEDLELLTDEELLQILGAGDPAGTRGDADPDLMSDLDTLPEPVLPDSTLLTAPSPSVPRLNDIVQPMTEDTTSPVEPPVDWDGSHLRFDRGCAGSCEAVTVRVCNVGDNMQGPVVGELWYSPDDNPQTGVPVRIIYLPPLAAGQCTFLSYPPPAGGGNYRYRLDQRPGHPFQDEIWSDTCEVLCP